MKKKILITAGGNPGNEYLWRSWKNKYQLYFTDNDLKKIHPTIPSTRKFKLPLATQINYKFEIKKIIRSLNIDHVIPYVDEELIKLSELFENSNKVNLLSPNKKFISLMLDKFKMISFFEKKGILVPKTFLLKEKNIKIKGSFVFKPRTGRGSRGVSFYKNTKILPNLKAFHKKDHTKWVIQKKISGSEYSVQIIADKNKNIKYVIPILVFEKKGSTIFAELNFDKTVIKNCVKIHNCFPVSGVYNIQLILTKKKLVYPFEINPRPSTTFCFLPKIGINPFNLMKDNEINHDLTNKKRLKLSRHYTNYFF